MSWLNDHESDVFVVCTANDVTKLPPEFSRSERFDSVFFLDLPGREEKQAIWDLYLNMFEIDRDQRLPDDANWTGAEVKACCRLAALLDMPPVQLPGDANMPLAQTYSFGVSQRMVVAPGHEEDGIFHMPTGQSAHPLSPFFGRGHEAWVQGERSPFLPGETRYTLRLEPGA